MDVNELNPGAYQQFFPDLTAPLTNLPAQTPEEELTNKLNPAAAGIPDLSLTPPAPSTTETTTKAPEVINTDLTAGEEEENKEGEDVADDNKKGRKPKYDFSDASGYFENRIKAGKFAPMEEDKEDGSTGVFIPRTPEEFDEFFDAQLTYKLEEARKENDQKWYGGKTPAWQAVAKYSEMVDNPAELIPFIQGVQTIQSVKDINENEIDGAEQIVRTRLLQRGEPQELIDEQIEALKTTDKLLSTAAKYKPIILQAEQKNLSEMMEERKRQEEEYLNTITEIRTNVMNTLETPLYGKKLKQEEKFAIYELIGEPSEEGQGYQIYSEIDTLFQKGDWDTLRQVALLLKKKDSFLSYIQANEAQRVSEGIQKRIRVAAESRSGNKDGFVDDQQKPAIKRETSGYKTGPRLSGYQNK